MKSHAYEIRAGEVARRAVAVLAPMIVFAVLMRLGAAAGWFPAPWPALDVDGTVLTHQALASGRSNDCDTLLIGDSSCLMNVSAAALRERPGSGLRPLNLGTFMYVGFGGYAGMVARYHEANPGRARLVVLLVHPEMLRGVPPVSSYTRLLSDLHAGTDPQATRSVRGQLCGFFGLNIFENRFLARCPRPLPGEFGRYYGFNLGLDRHMERAYGSAVDPHQYAPGPGQGNADYRLAPAIEPACAAFRAAMPPDAELVVGLTPVPESFASADHARRAADILLAWGAQLEAECLTNLPPTMPDSLFASTTHLNAVGAQLYSGLMAESLRPHLPSYGRASSR